jgi:dienelactone hydrolase
VHPRSIAPDRGRPTRGRAVGTFAKVALATSIAAGSIAAALPTQAAANPYERGPAPTAASINTNGPYQVDTYSTGSGLPGFTGGKIYAPRSNETFGAVAIVPGFVSSWDSMQWIGPRLASHGFVVIGIDTITPLDLPTERGQEVDAGLRFLLDFPQTKSRIDPGRTAIAGWSMGGGGSLQQARNRSDYKAVVAFAPWNLEVKDMSAVRIPSLIIGDQLDELAPNAEHAQLFYNTISAEKAFVSIAGTDHFFVWNPNRIQGSMTLSWLKRYVDNDTRYTPFLCPGPSGLDVQSYVASCPM